MPTVPWRGKSCFPRCARSAPRATGHWLTLPLAHFSGFAFRSRRDSGNAQENSRARLWHPQRARNQRMPVSPAPSANSHRKIAATKPLSASTPKKLSRQTTNAPHKPRPCPSASVAPASRAAMPTSSLAYPGAEHTSPSRGPTSDAIPPTASLASPVRTLHPAIEVWLQCNHALK
jgi:hypothetical protein